MVLARGAKTIRFGHGECVGTLGGVKAQTFASR